LSGYLIGAELAAARPYWLGQNVALIGTETLNAAYRDAIAGQGVPCTQATGSEMTRAGLLAAYLNLQEVTA
jgi:2-dehydro-3-deoxygalactonokinase